MSGSIYFMTWRAHLFISVHTCTHTYTHLHTPTVPPVWCTNFKSSHPHCWAKSPQGWCAPSTHRLWGADRAWRWLPPPPPGLPSAGVVDRAVGPHLGETLSRGLGLRETLGSRSGPSFLAIPPLQQKRAWEIQWWTSNAIASWEINPKTPRMVWK